MWRHFVLLVLVSVGCGPSFEAQIRFSGDVQEFDVDGLRVILHTDTNTPFISAGLFLSGGTAEIPNNTSVVIEECVFKSIVQDGPSEYAPEHFHRVMQRQDMPITFAIAKNYSMIGFRAMTSNVDTIWKYFAASISHPRFTEKTLQLLIRQKQAELHALKTDPNVYARHLAEMLQFADHPYSRFPTSQSVSALTNEDLANYHAFAFFKERLLLVVSGNINRSDLSSKIRAGLSALPSVASYRPSAGVSVKSRTTQVAFATLDRPLPTTYVRGIVIGPEAEGAEYYTFKDLCNILGSQLTHFLRVERSLSYAPYIEVVTGTPSYCIIGFETDSVREAMRITNTVLKQPKNFYYLGRKAKQYSVSHTYALEQQQSSWRRTIELGEATLLTGTWKNAFADYRMTDPVRLTLAANKYIKNILWVAVGDTTKLDRRWFY